MSRERIASFAASAAIVLTVALAGVRPFERPAQVAAAQAQPQTTLRVGMWTLWRDKELVLTPGAGATLRTCEHCATQAIANPISVRAAADEVQLTRPGSPSNSIQIWLSGTVTLAAHNETVTLQNPVTIAARAGVLVLAVTLPVETYVERVVASESGPTDTAESLKALAVVVRSYALHQPHNHADYDLCDSTHCQLLHWAEGSRRKSAAEAATLATAGETLWFRGQRALAYFSKDCGGHTAAPSEVWLKAKPAPYLASLPDRYCSNSGGAEWASNLSRAELASALATRGLVSPGWQQITVARRGESGRAVTLRIDATEISAEDFRLAVGERLGWNKIPSTWFEVSRQGDQFLFHGRGWGHGVGLCQKGAAAMGTQGHSAGEILAQYFPGAYSADEATGQSWKQFNGSGVTLESLGAADADYLPELVRARAEASQRSGLNTPAPITVRAFASTPAFRDATLEPGWVAAFTRGDWIATQPLRTLASRHLLSPTIRHEFLHALIEQVAGSKTPLWLREGLAEAWSADVPESAERTAQPALRLETLDDALTHSRSEAESRNAHLVAGWYAAHLLDRYGRAQVVEWLRSGIPAGVVATLRQR